MGSRASLSSPANAATPPGSIADIPLAIAPQQIVRAMPQLPASMTGVSVMLASGNASSIAAAVNTPSLAGFEHYSQVIDVNNAMVIGATNSRSRFKGEFTVPCQTQGSAWPAAWEPSASAASAPNVAEGSDDPGIDEIYESLPSRDAPLDMVAAIVLVVVGSRAASLSPEDRERRRLQRKTTRFMPAEAP
jgi:hypothetical protein